MNLLIDLGNTRLKWAFDDGSGPGALEAEVHAGRIDARLLNGLFGGAPRPERIACASVMGDVADRTLEQWCRHAWDRPVEFAASAARGFGIVNAYADPARLGVDRWVAMAGARSLTGGGFCVIDAGTAVTVDIVGDDGVHRGGWIVPGAGLLHQSLALGTARVRAAPGEAPPALGTDTDTCVRSGIAALFAGLARIIGERLAEHAIAPEAVFVTGGDADRLLRALPRANAVPALVLVGLARLLAEGAP